MQTNFTSFVSNFEAPLVRGFPGRLRSRFQRATPIESTVQMCPGEQSSSGGFECFSPKKLVEEIKVLP